MCYCLPPHYHPQCNKQMVSRRARGSMCVCVHIGKMKVILCHLIAAVGSNTNIFKAGNSKYNAEIQRGSLDEYRMLLKGISSVHILAAYKSFEWKFVCSILLQRTLTFSSGRLEILDTHLQTTLIQLHSKLTWSNRLKLRSCSLKIYLNDNMTLDLYKHFVPEH